jgi:hypothetical protein
LGCGTTKRNMDIVNTVKYCPNGECVNFQIELQTNARTCPMCGWIFVLVKKSAESTKKEPGQSEVA